MMVASTMGATAFQKGLGAMHALAHPLGGQFNAHHGLLNAILMPYIVKANRAAIQTRIERLARHINLGDTSFDGFLLWLLNLRRDLAIPHSLKEIEVDDAHASLIGQMAFDDPSAAGNPISFTPQEYEQIFTSAVRGQL